MTLLLEATSTGRSGLTAPQVLRLVWRDLPLDLFVTLPILRGSRFSILRLFQHLSATICVPSLISATQAIRTPSRRRLDVVTVVESRSKRCLPSSGYMRRRYVFTANFGSDKEVARYYVWACCAPRNRTRLVVAVRFFLKGWPRSLPLKSSVRTITSHLSLPT